LGVRGDPYYRESRRGIAGNKCRIGVISLDIERWISGGKLGKYIPHPLDGPAIHMPNAFYTESIPD